MHLELLAILDLGLIVFEPLGLDLTASSGPCGSGRCRTTV
jgi:hypothetical protein